MKISNNPNIHRILKTYQKTNEKFAHSIQKGGQKKDQIEISEKAKDFQIAFQAYQRLPEIREEKVQELIQQIRAGKYNPSTEKIVESMIDKKI
jgi:negative regulator of flagellin synthesis FlgM